MFKKLLISVAIAMSFSAANAADKPVLDVLVASGNTGNTWAMSQIIRDGLVAQGYDSEIVWTKNCQNTEEYMKENSGRPGFFTRSGGRYVKDLAKGCDIPVTEEAFILPIFKRLQTMCVRKEDQFATLDEFLANKNRVTIATTNTLPPAAYEGIQADTGTKFVRVDFDGSKRIIAGLLAGDTDLMYSSYTGREANHEDLYCFASSADAGVSINGMTTFSELFPSWRLKTAANYQYFHAVNIPSERMQEVKDSLAKLVDKDPKMSNYISSANMVPGTQIENGLQTFLESVEFWKAK